jgi:hypothetical protein
MSSIGVSDISIVNIPAEDIVHLRQQWQNYNSVKTTTVSQLQQCHNSKFVTFREKLLKVLKCYNFLSATTTQLLSSGEFCKLRYDIIPVKSASANVSFYTNNSKMPNFEL